MQREALLLSGAVWEPKKVNDVMEETQKQLKAIIGAKSASSAERVWESPTERLQRAGIKVDLN